MGFSKIFFGQLKTSYFKIAGLFDDLGIHHNLYSNMI